jgi:hypothetical protein
MVADCWPSAVATALAWVALLSFLGSTLLFAGRPGADPAMGLHPATSISTRFMIATYCLWFAAAAWGSARRAA